MKKLGLFIVLTFFTFALQAQNVFNKDDMMVNAGIGILSPYGPIPSVNASLEVGVIPTGDIGIVSFGGITAYQLGSYYFDAYSDLFHVFVIGPRATWHLQTFNSNKWDVYGGIGFGILIKSGYNDSWGNHIKGFVSGYGEGFVGGRMMLKDNFGLFAETGYGTLSSFKFGITINM